MAAQVLRTLAVTNRQGVFQTPSVVVPVSVAGAELQVTLQVDAGAIADSVNTALIRLYVLDEATQAWRVYTGVEWRGFPGASATNPDHVPTMTATLAPLVGRTIRGEVEFPVRLRVGVTVQLWTP